MRKWVGVVCGLVLLLALCGAWTEAPQTLIVIDVDLQMLTLYKQGERIQAWPCAVGKPSTPSPLGVWKVNHKAANWGSGFGSRWLGINCPWGKFGIHGTNKPGSIGAFASHGCIRMLNRDVEALYPQVPIGATVLIERAAFGDMAGGIRTLSPGDRGADVKQLQLRLNNMGYNVGSPDGVFGEATKRALVRYREAQRLPAGDTADWAVYKALGIQLYE